MDHILWDQLPHLVRAKSKESVEQILQMLWSSRKTGLNTDQRTRIRDLLQLPLENELDPLLVCLRILIRRCVYDNFSKDDILKLFPPEVPPELQRLLALLLYKFQREWREDAIKDQVSLPCLKAMTWSMENQDAHANPTAVINLKLQDNSESSSVETEVKFQITKDTLEAMLRSMYYIRDQLSNTALNTTGQSGKKGQQ